MAKFFRRGKTRALWVPDIADPDAPTITEIGAGTELSASVQEIEGWGYTTDRIETPTLADEFTASIGGEQKADDSSLKIYLDSVSNPLRSTLAFNEEGFMVFCDFKPQPDALDVGDLVDVYAAIVIGTPKERSLGNVAAAWTAEFGQTAIPSEDVAIVAASS